jgi:inosine/xanthosine triphosphatase
MNNKMKKIAVASKNPVKIEGVLRGFQRMFPDEQFEMIGISAPSGVADQPMSHEETLRGAKNRTDHISLINSDADYWVGVEAGIATSEEEMECFGHVTIKSKEGQWSKGSTGCFILPPALVDLVNKGMELGRAVDVVFNCTDSKHSNGVVGALTHNKIDRTEYIVHAVILALVPFKNPHLYPVKII